MAPQTLILIPPATPNVPGTSHGLRSTPPTPDEIITGAILPFASTSVCAEAMTIATSPVHRVIDHDVQRI